jgi:hypothetical protein
MGLDQNAGKQNHQFKWTNSEGKDYSYEGIGPFEWRKHARLQEFMTRLFMSKNDIESNQGSNKAWVKTSWNGMEDYMPLNFDEVELTLNDIDLLEEAVNNGYKDYECDGGFFWGHQYQEESVKDYLDRDKEFVKFAKQRLSKGKKVFYSCNW